MPLYVTRVRLERNYTQERQPLRTGQQYTVTNRTHPLTTRQRDPDPRGDSFARIRRSRDVVTRSNRPYQPGGVATRDRPRRRRDRRRS